MTASMTSRKDNRNLRTMPLSGSSSQRSTRITIDLRSISMIGLDIDNSTQSGDRTDILPFLRNLSHQHASTKRSGALPKVTSDIATRVQLESNGHRFLRNRSKLMDGTIAADNFLSKLKQSLTAVTTSVNEASINQSKSASSDDDCVICEVSVAPANDQYGHFMNGRGDGISKAEIVSGEDILKKRPVDKRRKAKIRMRNRSGNGHKQPISADDDVVMQNDSSHVATKKEDCAASTEAKYNCVTGSRSDLSSELPPKQDADSFLNCDDFGDFSPTRVLPARVCAVKIPRDKQVPIILRQDRRVDRNQLKMATLNKTLESTSSIATNHKSASGNKTACFRKEGSLAQIMRFLKNSTKVRKNDNLRTISVVNRAMDREAFHIPQKLIRTFYQDGRRVSVESCDYKTAVQEVYVLKPVISSLNVIGSEMVILSKVCGAQEINGHFPSEIKHSSAAADNTTSSNLLISNVESVAAMSVSNNVSLNGMVSQDELEISGNAVTRTQIECLNSSCRPMDCSRADLSDCFAPLSKRRKICTSYKKAGKISHQMKCGNKSKVTITSNRNDVNSNPDLYHKDDQTASCGIVPEVALSCNEIDFSLSASEQLIDCASTSIHSINDGSCTSNKRELDDVEERNYCKLLMHEKLARTSGEHPDASNEGLSTSEAQIVDSDENITETDNVLLASNSTHEVLETSQHQDSLNNMKTMSPTDKDCEKSNSGLATDVCQDIYLENLYMDPTAVTDIADILIVPASSQISNISTVSAVKLPEIISVSTNLCESEDYSEREKAVTKDVASKQSNETSTVSELGECCDQNIETEKDKVHEALGSHVHEALDELCAVNSSECAPVSVASRSPIEKQSNGMETWQNSSSNWSACETAASALNPRALRKGNIFEIMSSDLRNSTKVNPSVNSHDEPSCDVGETDFQKMSPESATFSTTSVIQQCQENSDEINSDTTLSTKLGENCLDDKHSSTTTVSQPQKDSTQIIPASKTKTNSFGKDGEETLNSLPAMPAESQQNCVGSSSLSTTCSQSMTTSSVTTARDPESVCKAAKSATAESSKLKEKQCDTLQLQDHPVSDHPLSSKTQDVPNINEQDQIIDERPIDEKSVASGLNLRIVIQKCKNHKWQVKHPTAEDNDVNKNEQINNPSLSKRNVDESSCNSNRRKSTRMRSRVYQENGVSALEQQAKTVDVDASNFLSNDTADLPASITEKDDVVETEILNCQTSKRRKSHASQENIVSALEQQTEIAHVDVDASNLLINDTTDLPTSFTEKDCFLEAEIITLKEDHNSSTEINAGEGHECSANEGITDDNRKCELSQILDDGQNCVENQLDLSIDNILDTTTGDVYIPQDGLSQLLSYGFDDWDTAETLPEDDQVPEDDQYLNNFSPISLEGNSTADKCFDGILQADESMTFGVMPGASPETNDDNGNDSLLLTISETVSCETSSLMVPRDLCSEANGEAETILSALNEILMPESLLPSCPDNTNTLFATTFGDVSLNSVSDNTAVFNCHMGNAETAKNSAVDSCENDLRELSGDESSQNKTTVFRVIPMNNIPLSTGFILEQQIQPGNDSNWQRGESARLEQQLVCNHDDQILSSSASCEFLQSAVDRDADDAIEFVPTCNTDTVHVNTAISSCEATNEQLEHDQRTVATEEQQLQTTEINSFESPGSTLELEIISKQISNDLSQEKAGDVVSTINRLPTVTDVIKEDIEERQEVITKKFQLRPCAIKLVRCSVEWEKSPVGNKKARLSRSASAVTGKLKSPFVCVSSSLTNCEQLVGNIRKLRKRAVREKADEGNTEMVSVEPSHNKRKSAMRTRQLDRNTALITAEVEGVLQATSTGEKSPKEKTSWELRHYTATGPEQQKESLTSNDAETTSEVSGEPSVRKISTDTQSKRSERNSVDKEKGLTTVVGAEEIFDYVHEVLERQKAVLVIDKEEMKIDSSNRIKQHATAIHVQSSDKPSGDSACDEVQALTCANKELIPPAVTNEKILIQSPDQHSVNECNHGKQKIAANATNIAVQEPTTVEATCKTLERPQLMVRINKRRMSANEIAAKNNKSLSLLASGQQSAPVIGVKNAVSEDDKLLQPAIALTASGLENTPVTGANIPVCITTDNSSLQHINVVVKDIVNDAVPVNFILPQDMTTVLADKGNEVSITDETRAEKTTVVAQRSCQQTASLKNQTHTHPFTHTSSKSRHSKPTSPSDKSRPNITSDKTRVETSSRMQLRPLVRSGKLVTDSEAEESNTNEVPQAEKCQLFTSITVTSGQPSSTITMDISKPDETLMPVSVNVQEATSEVRSKTSSPCEIADNDNMQIMTSEQNVGLPELKEQHAISDRVKKVNKSEQKTSVVVSESKKLRKSSDDKLWAEKLEVVSSTVQQRSSAGADLAVDALKNVSDETRNHHRAVVDDKSPKASFGLVAEKLKKAKTNKLKLSDKIQVGTKSMEDKTVQQRNQVERHKPEKHEKTSGKEPEKTGQLKATTATETNNSRNKEQRKSSDPTKVKQQTTPKQQKTTDQTPVKEQYDGKEQQKVTKEAAITNATIDIQAVTEQKKLAEQQKSTELKTAERGSATEQKETVKGEKQKPGMDVKTWIDNQVDKDKKRENARLTDLHKNAQYSTGDKKKSIVQSAVEQKTSVSEKTVQQKKSTEQQKSKVQRKSTEHHMLTEQQGSSHQHRTTDTQKIENQSKKIAEQHAGSSKHGIVDQDKSAVKKTVADHPKRVVSDISTDHKTVDQPKTVELDKSADNRTVAQPKGVEVYKSAELRTLDDSNCEKAKMEGKQKRYKQLLDVTTARMTKAEHQKCPEIQKTFELPQTGEVEKVKQTITEQQATKQTTAEQEQKTKLTIEQQKTKPTTEQQATKQTTTEQQKTKPTTTAAELKKKQPTTEQQKTKQTTDQQKTKQTTTEQQKTKPTTEQQKTKQTTEQQKAKQTTTDQQKTKQTTTEQEKTKPTTDQQKTKQRTTDQQKTKPTTALEQQKTKLTTATEQQKTKQTTATEQKMKQTAATEQQKTKQPAAEQQRTKPIIEQQKTKATTALEQRKTKPTTTTEQKMKQTAAPEQQKTKQPAAEQQRTKPIIEQQKTKPTTATEQQKTKPTTATEQQKTKQTATVEQQKKKRTTPEQQRRVEEHEIIAQPISESRQHTQEKLAALSTKDDSNREQSEILAPHKMAEDMTTRHHETVVQHKPAERVTMGHDRGRLKTADQQQKSAGDQIKPQEQTMQQQKTDQEPAQEKRKTHQVPSQRHGQKTELEPEKACKTQERRDEGDSVEKKNCELKREHGQIKTPEQIPQHQLAEITTEQDQRNTKEPPATKHQELIEQSTGEQQDESRATAQEETTVIQDSAFLQDSAQQLAAEQCAAQQEQRTEKSRTQEENPRETVKEDKTAQESDIFEETSEFSKTELVTSQVLFEKSTGETSRKNCEFITCDLNSNEAMYRTELQTNSDVTDSEQTIHSTNEKVEEEDTISIPLITNATFLTTIYNSHTACKVTCQDSESEDDTSSCSFDEPPASPSEWREYAEVKSPDNDSACTTEEISIFSHVRVGPIEIPLNVDDPDDLLEAVRTRGNGFWRPRRGEDFVNTDFAMT